VYVSSRVRTEVRGGKVGSGNMRVCVAPCATGMNSCGRFSSHSTKAKIPFPAYLFGTIKVGVAYVSPYLSVTTDFRN